MGETPRNATSSSAATASSHFHHVVQDLRAISTMGTAMSDTTTGRIPLNARTTQGLSLKAVKNIAMARMMKNDGVMLPRVAAILPLTPRSRYPAKMDMLTAMTPGALCERAAMSGSSSSEIQPRRAISARMTGIMAYPPPMVKAPILAKTVKIFHRGTLGFPESGFFIWQK